MLQYNTNLGDSWSNFPPSSNLTFANNTPLTNGTDDSSTSSKFTVNLNFFFFIINDIQDYISSTIIHKKMTHRRLWYRHGNISYNEINKRRGSSTILRWHNENNVRRQSSVQLTTSSYFEAIIHINSSARKRYFSSNHLAKKSNRVPVLQTSISHRNSAFLKRRR